MSGRPFNEFAGLTDTSRVRKPPGGNTHDIFGLEIRQKREASQVYPNNEIKATGTVDQGSKCMPIQNVGTTDEYRGQEPTSGSGSNVACFDVDKNQQFQTMRDEVYHNFSNANQDLFKESGNIFKNVEHDIPVAGGIDYAGVTDKTRVRKPPGGDTNDIFDLESRQRCQAVEKQLNLMSLKNMHQGRIQTEIRSSNPMDQKISDTVRPTTNQLKRGQLNENQFDQLLFHVDKENVNLLPEAETEKKQDSLDEDDYSKLPTKKYLIHNPITGEINEMKVSNIYKLADCSNVASSPGLVKKPEVNKPSVRVRQPPGGVSSHIF